MGIPPFLPQGSLSLGLKTIIDESKKTAPRRVIGNKNTRVDAVRMFGYQFFVLPHGAQDNAAFKYSIQNTKEGRK